MWLRRVVSALLLVAYLPACTSFQATTQPLAELTAPPTPVDEIRVTTAIGQQLRIRDPRIVNDTLRGFSASRGTDVRALAVPVADIRTVEVRKSDGTETILLVGGIVGVTVLLVAASCSGSESYGWGC